MAAVSTGTMTGIRRADLLAAFGGAVTMFLIQPPVDWWWLAWLAPLPWIWLAARPTAVKTPQISWGWLWLAGWLHWLATIHWLRLPHPATSIGWLLLTAYLAIYLPAFVWLTRRLIGRWHWPLLAATPVAWMGCEQMRSWFFGGFTFGLLGHSQWRWTALLQLTDITGAVGMSGLVMVVATALFSLIRWSYYRRFGCSEIAVCHFPFRSVLNGLLVATVGLLAALGYGWWRLATTPDETGKPLDVLLVQGSIDTEFKHDPAAVADVTRHYDELTRSGLTGHGPQPDLIIWPETMWRIGLIEIDPAQELPDSVVDMMLAEAESDSTPMTKVNRQARARQLLEAERFDPLATYAKSYGTHWLVGVDKQRITPEAATGAEHFNCGVLLDADGQLVGSYAKMYPVLFGEYVPLANRFPWLYRLTPLPAGLTAGRVPLSTTVAGQRLTCTICYETALPEAIRLLVKSCRATNGGPDVIANLTNDGWFWGSSELDMHLTAAIFRAVEVRTPIVIAANTGFSAAIDGCGRLLAKGPRRATATLRVGVRPDGRPTPWLFWGSLLSGVCVAIAGGVTLEACCRGVSLGK